MIRERGIPAGQRIILCIAAFVFGLLLIAYGIYHAVPASHTASAATPLVSTPAPANPPPPKPVEPAIRNPLGYLPEIVPATGWYSVTAPVGYWSLPTAANPRAADRANEYKWLLKPNGPIEFLDDSHPHAIVLDPLSEDPKQRNFEVGPTLTFRVKSHNSSEIVVDYKFIRMDIWEASQKAITPSATNPYVHTK